MNHKRPHTRLLALLPLLLPASLSLAQPTPASTRIDPDTGRSLAQYPASPTFDHLHMRLALDIPDMHTPRMLADHTLTVQPRGRPRDHITLNAQGMAFSLVEVAGKPARYTHTNDLLTIHFEKPVLPAQRLTIRTRYEVTHMPQDDLGIVHVPASETPNNFPVIFSQGQTSHNSEWFPCHDHPNERLTTELIVTVPAGVEVLSNGELISHRTGRDNRDTWHWRQNEPHPAYLVTLVAGQFDRVELPSAEGLSRDIPMTIWSPEGTGERAAELFDRTADILAFFEHYFDEPYPYAKYDQIVVPGYTLGAMENTTASTFMIQSLILPKPQLEDIIVHEVTHQWIGNMLTCRSWEHLWLNEGWASYTEVLWREEIARRNAGPEAARETYLGAIAGMLSAHRLSNRAVAPAANPMVSPFYGDEWELFGSRADNVYSKGALVLHMLRAKLGDELFRTATRLYIDRHRWSEVETHDLRRVFEDVSGLSLAHFFDQWCRRTGIPRLEMQRVWNPEENTLTIRARQTQHIDKHNPAFVFDLPIQLTLPDGSVHTRTLSMTSREASATFPLPAEPAGIIVDPDITVLAAITGGLQSPDYRSPDAWDWDDAAPEHTDDPEVDLDDADLDPEADAEEPAELPEPIIDLPE